MITKNDEAVWHEVIPGISVSTLVHGEKTLMTRFRLQERSFLPLHAHPQEQTGYLVSGRLTMTIDGVEHQFGPGDSWSIPGGVEHGAVVHETAIAVEVFSPVREDYLPYLPPRD
jgi:quercetin dioxygenase-like cupin family protein